MLSLVLLAGVGVLLGQAVPGQEERTLRRLVIVDNEGRPRIILDGQNEQGRVALEMRSPEGNTQLVLQQYEKNARFDLYDAEGRQRHQQMVSADGTGMSLADADEEIRMMHFVSNQGDAHSTIGDSEGTQRIRHRVLAAGHADMTLLDGEGNARVYQTTLANGYASLVMNDTKSRTRLMMESNAQDAAAFVILDPTEAPRILGTSTADGAVAWRMADEQGRDRVTLVGSEAMSALVVHDTQQRPRLALGMEERDWATLDLWGGGEHARVTLAASVDGDAEITLQDERGDPQASLSATRAGSALMLRHAQQGPLLELSVNDNYGRVALFDEKEQSRLMMSLVKGDVSLGLHDQQGRSRVTLLESQAGRGLLLENPDTGSSVSLGATPQRPGTLAFSHGESQASLTIGLLPEGEVQMGIVDGQDQLRWRLHHEPTAIWQSFLDSAGNERLILGHGDNELPSAGFYDAEGRPVKLLP